MKTLQQEGTLILPTIDFNPINGELKLLGRSIPEHPVKFYQPIDQWIVDYIATNPDRVHLFIHLDYLNTHSTECILILMKKLEAYFEQSKKDVSITWGFDEDDEDMQILGEDLGSLLKLPYVIIELKEDA